MEPRPVDRPTGGGPAGEEPGRAGGPRPEGPDPLYELSQRVRVAQQAAERILSEASEAAGQAATGQRPPPRGYAGADGGQARRSAEAQALLALLDLGRALVPAELPQALADLVRELLLAVRALIDWYLERLDERRRASVEVEDIPIS